MCQHSLAAATVRNASSSASDSYGAGSAKAARSVLMKRTQGRSRAVPCACGRTGASPGAALTVRCSPHSAMPIRLGNSPTHVPPWANNLSAADARHVEAHSDCPPGGHLRSVPGHARVAALQQLVQINPRIQPGRSNGCCFRLEAARVLKMQRVYTSPRCICAAQPTLHGIDQPHFWQRGGSTLKVARRGQPRLLIGWADER